MTLDQREENIETILANNQPKNIIQLMNIEAACIAVSKGPCGVCPKLDPSGLCNASDIDSKEALRNIMVKAVGNILRRDPNDNYEGCNHYQRNLTAELEA